MGNAGGAEAGKESGNVAGVRNGEGAGRAVVMQREAEKFSSDGVGFGMVKVRGVVVKSEGWWYLTPKSSTTKTKVMEREAWRKRPGVGSGESRRIGGGRQDEGWKVYLPL